MTKRWKMVEEPEGGNRFVPGLYRHFKKGGGHYYAMGVAHSHESDPGKLEDPYVIYWSYTHKHWRWRPLSSPGDLPDKDRVGWTDTVRREGYDGVPRFRLVQEVWPHTAFLFHHPEPIIPVGYSEPVSFFAPHPGVQGATQPIPEPLRVAAAALDGKTLALGEALAALSSKGPPACSIRASPLWHMVTAQMPGGAEGLHSWRVIRFRRGEDFPPEPAFVGVKSNQ